MKLKECPYCKREMAEGYIQTLGTSIAWTPKEKRLRLSKLRHKVEKYETRLGKYTYMRGGVVVAYKCDNCNVVIIDDLKNNDYK